MSSVSSSATGVDYTPVVSPLSGTQQSLLFPPLLKMFDPVRRISVLEIGSALPETIKFLSQFKCRINFAAMYLDPVLQAQTDDFTEAELVAQMRRSFDFPKGTRFDLCLFWDFLNYLDDKKVQAFSSAIAPYLHKTTRAHAFTVRTLDTTFPNQQYGIKQAHMFTIRSRETRQAPNFPHTQATLVNLLPSFDIDQGMLLPDGRLEVLLTACV